MSAPPAREPAFSVVIPAYNAAATIAGAIRSVLAQTRADFELHVVDDSSTDATAEAIGPFLVDERVRLLRRSVNGGVSAARNTAIAAASAPLVAFLDSDDLWMPTYLERMGRALDERRDADLAYTEAWMLDRETTRFHRRTTSFALEPVPEEPPLDRDGLVAALLRSNFVFCAATVRRDVLARLGAFDESLAAAEDYDLWMRLALQGSRMVRIKEPLVIYRRTSGTLSGDPIRLERHRREVFRRVAESAEISASTRALAEAQVERAERRLAAYEGDRSPRAIIFRLRRRLGPSKNRVIRPFTTRTKPPTEIAAAFQEFARRPARGAEDDPS
jgi:GT2 family glycosyltransferase